MTMRPMARVSARPIFVQPLPPSVDLYTPSPQYWERRLFFSPVPTQRTLVSEGATARSPTVSLRSEEHTSELQSPCNLVCRLLLETKKNTRHDLAAATGSSPREKMRALAPVRIEPW